MADRGLIFNESPGRDCVTSISAVYLLIVVLDGCQVINCCEVLG